ncbi:MAG: efflux RND transporter periplasmic adaptor subunit [Gammaproteobacteria bacterium]
MSRCVRFVACATIVALVGCAEPDQEQTNAPTLRPVRVAVVTQSADVRTRAFSGVSQSTQASRMSFQVSGSVVELPVQVGDRLAAGQMIARLNPSTYDLQVQQAEASLAQATASQRNADANYSRVKGLYANANASRNDLDSARASFESAEAQVQSARKARQIAQLNRSYTRLDAANDCTVASVDVELNENVNAGAQVAKVNCGAGIEIRLGIPESLIGDFEQKMPAIIKFSALGDREYLGEVTEVGVASGASAATYPVVVTLLDSGADIRPSMAAEVTFEFSVGAASGAFVIPASAVINDERGRFVFIAEPSADGQATIRRRQVEVGELTERGIQIRDGLSLGERVVTAGTTVIRENQIVLLPDA